MGFNSGFKGLNLSIIYTILHNHSEILHVFLCVLLYICWSQWPHGLRRRSAAARLLRIVGSNPIEGTDVCCHCCVLSGRGLCDELITRPEESYRLWYVVVCDLETS